MDEYMTKNVNPGGKSASLWKIIKMNYGKKNKDTISTLLDDGSFITDDFEKK